MIFDYFSEIHGLVYDCCWNMFEFTSLMLIYAYVLVGLNWCGCFEVWMKNEKNGGCWWKWTRWWFLRWIGGIIRCLLLFWMHFYVCNQVFKFWGQGGQNGGFGVKNWEFSRGNNQIRATCSGAARLASSVTP